MGLKKIPPPIPTIPDINPIEPPIKKEKIFGNGKSFMNIEVIWPQSVNVVPYGQPLLVFHGTMEYDESGTAIG